LAKKAFTTAVHPVIRLVEVLRGRKPAQALVFEGFPQQPTGGRAPEHASWRCTTDDQSSSGVDVTHRMRAFQHAPMSHWNRKTPEMNDWFFGVWKNTKSLQQK